MIDLIKQENFEFKKKFGQNFIFDTNLLRAIVREAGITKQDNVLEIGVGAGTLTNAIGESANKVVGVEIDKTLEPILQQNINQNNIQIVFKDFMEMTQEEIHNLVGKNFKVVANLPYYITTPIIFKLLETEGLTSLSIMVQKEVADRLCAKPSSKDYGAITAQIDVQANATITRVVNRNMFCPAPNVDSAVVKIDIDKNKFNILNKQLLQKVIASAFAMRRKTLSNNLKSAFSINQEQINNICAKININPLARGETLSSQDFVNLANELNNIKL